MCNSITPVDVVDPLALQALVKGEPTVVYVAAGKNAQLDKPAFQAESRVWIRELWASAAKTTGDCAQVKSPECVYQATDPTALDARLNCQGTGPAKWRRPQQMPRWASRLTCHVGRVALQATNSLPEHVREQLKGTVAWAVELVPDN